MATEQTFRTPDTVTSAEKRWTLIAVMIVFFLSALDMTIIGTAMPRIVADLDGLDLYPWVTTSYMLASTVMVPIWGKLGDLYGRKRILMIGVAIFVGASWLCGVSGEFGPMPIIGDGMMQLIVFRGLQGLGGGALFTSAFGVIADLFPPRERAKYAGLFGAVFGLSAILGPLIGGFFTDHGTTTIGGLEIAGWRWIFYINLPTALAAMLILARRMPDLRHGKGGKVDLPGAALVVIAIGALLLALSWGGRDYGWSSPIILGLVGLFAIALLSFIAVERKVADPILPIDMFNDRSFSTANVASLVMAMAFMGTIIYLPLYLQIGLGVTATTSGLAMLPLMLGLTVASALAGRRVRESGLYRRYILMGCGVLVIGLGGLAMLDEGAKLWQVNLWLVVVGLGLGPSQSLFTLIVQNAVPLTRIGVGTSTAQFFRQIGSTIGVAIFGALLLHELDAQFTKRVPGQHIDLGQLRALGAGSAEGVNTGPVQVPPIIQEVFSATMTMLFEAAIVIVLIAAIIVAFIPHVPLRDTFKAKAEPFPEPGEGAGGVTQAAKGKPAAADQG